jgi:hypothetical protein
MMTSLLLVAGQSVRSASRTRRTERPGIDTLETIFEDALTRTTRLFFGAGMPNTLLARITRAPAASGAVEGFAGTG